YRRGQGGVSRLIVLRRADAIRAVGVGPHCWRRQSTRTTKISVLDGRCAPRRGPRGMASQRNRTPGVMVARLALLDQGTGFRGGRSAAPRRQHVCPDRGRTGELCEGAKLKRIAAWG